MEAHLSSSGLSGGHLCTCSQLAAHLELTYESVYWCWLSAAPCLQQVACPPSYGGGRVPRSKKGFSRVNMGEDCAKDHAKASDLQDKEAFIIY